MDTISQPFSNLHYAAKDEISSAYFVVSQISIDNEYASYKIRSSDLFKQIMKSFALSIGIKSMAYETSSEYALSCHDHDVYTSVFLSSHEAPADDMLVLSSLDDNDASSRIYSKHGSSSCDSISARILELQPKIGQIAFMLSADTNIESKDFIGWVFADGSQYQLYDFVLSTALSNIFISNNGLFQVPNLTGFFKLCNSFSSQTTYANGHSAVAQHSHHAIVDESNNKLTISINQLNFGITKVGSKEMYGEETAFWFPTCKGPSVFGPHLHYGDKYKQTIRIESIPHSLDQNTFQNANLCTTDDGSDPQGIGYSYPDNQTLKAFVYIGRSRYSSPLVS